MTGAAKGTVAKLLADLGDACSTYMDTNLRDLPCQRIQCDEIWAFVGMKQKNVPQERKGEFGVGDVWTWVALDADTKLVPSYYVGMRDGSDAYRFLGDLAKRLRNRVQLTTDSWRAYLTAVETTFGDQVDYAQIHKIFGPDPSAERRYSPPICRAGVLIRTPKSKRMPPLKISLVEPILVRAGVAQGETIDTPAANIGLVEPIPWLQGGISGRTGVAPCRVDRPTRRPLGTPNDAERGIDNVEFLEGSIYELGFPDASFDVCTLFSMMETLDDPLAALAEVRRVVRPGGLVGASSIEYGGLILHGPGEPLLRRFYELRLKLWERDVRVYRGRELRRLLLRAGFEDVEAGAAYFSYGTEERVRSFGRGRAADCRDDWYVDALTRQGFADQDEIDALEQAWLRWAESPDSFAAFAWGRAIARRP